MPLNLFKFLIVLIVVLSVLLPLKKSDVLVVFVVVIIGVVVIAGVVNIYVLGFFIFIFVGEPRV